MVFKDPVQEKHHKGQNFVLCSKTMVEKNSLHIPKPKINVPSNLEQNLTLEKTLSKI